MIKLYDKFMDWYHGGVIWLIGDTHFNDEDCHSIDPSWPSPEEHVKIINSCVGKADTLVILGDVGDEQFVSRLKGYKVLIMGNHDKGASNYKRSFKWKAKDIITDYFVREDDNHLFDEVYEGPVFINEKILLSHEPIDLSFGINIHGHVHGGKRSSSEPNGEKGTGHYEHASFNLCSDVIGYKPVRLDLLVRGVKVKDIHRITIDSRPQRRIKEESNNSPGGSMTKLRWYKIDVDCANCANKMEEAANKTKGVKKATVSFMTLKMIVEFSEGADPDETMKKVRENCKNVESDCEIFL